jgi:protein phosphatase
MLISESISRGLESTDDYSGEAAPARRRVSAEVSALTHAGLARGKNEDQLLVARLGRALEVLETSLSAESTAPIHDDRGYLMIVADGMGGAAAGEKASALAIESLERYMVSTFHAAPGPGHDDDQTVCDELRAGVELADRQVLEYAQSNPRLAGMGTTLTMAYSVDADLYVVHVGDSRAYLFRDHRLQQITSDHTLVHEMMTEGYLSAADARRHRLRHVVTNVLGGPGKGVHVEVHKIALQDGDIVLLCSDGLSEPLGDEELAGILDGAQSPRETCRELIKRTLERGAPDNVTAIVAQYRVD